MIVCVCRGISDRQLRAEAAAGHSLEQVMHRTGAGSSCGTCRFAIARLVSDEHARIAAADRAGKKDAA